MSKEKNSIIIKKYEYNILQLLYNFLISIRSLKALIMCVVKKQVSKLAEVP